MFSFIELRFVDILDIVLSAYLMYVVYRLIRGTMAAKEIAIVLGERLGWKKTTTYTMLKRLCERGIFQNENGVVPALMSKEEFGAAQSEKIIEDNFDGSLPAFIAAFASRRKLSKKDVEEIQKMIDKMKED